MSLESDRYLIGLLEQRSCRELAVLLLATLDALETEKARALGAITANLREKRHADEIAALLASRVTA